MEDGSPLTESSADGDTDEKNQMVIYFKYVISKCLVYRGLLVEGKHKWLVNAVLVFVHFFFSFNNLANNNKV